MSRGEQMIYNNKLFNLLLYDLLFICYIFTLLFGIELYKKEEGLYFFVANGPLTKRLCP
jgi:hypothetical protein